jgi:crossover junction endodeoxyribonuclease RuvC
MTIILGIDPGSRATGYGIISSVGATTKCIAYGVLRIAKTTFAAQLNDIFHGIFSLVQKHRPDEVAIEQVFVQRNVNSALKLGQARGAAIVAVAQYQLPLFDYSTRQVKQAVVGYGAAEKSQIQHMIKALLKLHAAPPQDAADALAIALCHANMRKYAALTKNKSIALKNYRS